MTEAVDANITTHASDSAGVPLLSSAARFVREHAVKFAAVSAVVLVPCFWHREIAADDLGSHLYNAWLAQLVQRGQAPGLWLSGQRTNVLFDWLLSGLGSMFGFRTAEKIAVSLAVLIFFWGAFALISAATRRAPWFLPPVIGLAAYGWTFHMGFFNYYSSLGLGFFALAIWWRGRGWERVIALGIAALVAVAHPLGFIWLAGAVVYLAVADRSSWRLQMLLFAVAATATYGMRYYLMSRYVTEAGTPPFYRFNGADQTVLFGNRYHVVEFALLAFVLAALSVDIFRRRREGGLWASYAIPLQLYLLVWLAVLLFPGGVKFPSRAAPIALLTERLTSVSIVLMCCLLGAMRPRRWHLIGGATIAVVFFAFVYQDTARVNAQETRIAELVRTLPPNQRVMGTILPPPDSRVMIQHILDRACIGYCFDYGNYEPSAQVFRVRATHGNPYVLNNYDEATSMEDGEYVVQPEDLPLYQVYQRNIEGAEFGVHALKAGEKNDSFGVHPPEERE